MVALSEKKKKSRTTWVCLFFKSYLSTVNCTKLCVKAHPTPIAAISTQPITVTGLLPYMSAKIPNKEALTRTPAMKMDCDRPTL